MGASGSGKGPRVAHVALRNGRFVMMIDDEPVFPMMYGMTGAAYGNWEQVAQRNVELFAEVGFRLYEIDVWFRDIWAPDGTLDVACAARQARSVLDICPSAALFVRLNITGPHWWVEQNPDECVWYADGPPAENLNVDACERIRRNSHVSEKWRRETTDKLVEFCRRLSAMPEGDAVIGLHLAGGAWGEWFYWGFPHEPDTGPAMTRHFRTWLREKYRTDAALQTAWNDPNVTFETAAVPGLEERYRTQHGIFRDPQQERKVIDYGRCHQEAVSDTILHFCRAAKEHWPRHLLTGAFYGYFLHIHDMVSGGNLETERVFTSPYIDFMSTPVSYELDARCIGGSGHFRCLPESIRRHGKLWMSEMDHPTFLGDSFRRPEPFVQTTVADSIAVLRRNVAQSFALGQGLWYYDFGPNGPGGWWDHPELLAEIRRLKSFGDSLLDKPWSSAADVLFVYDTQCFYYLGLHRNKTDTVSFAAINRTVAEAYHCGVLFDLAQLSDLPLIDLDPYRVVVFAFTPLLTAEQRTWIRDRVAHEGRTLVWVYAPGYADGETLDAGHMTEVVGMQLAPAPLPLPPELYVAAQKLGPSFPEVRVAVDAPVHPLFAVKDASAAPLGYYAGTRHVALAQKDLGQCASWFCALPLRNPYLMREIFRRGGAHIYSEDNDVIFGSRELLCVHTESGGLRRIALRNDSYLETELPPWSTTLFDPRTGERLLG